jgi:hypothetical protein
VPSLLHFDLTISDIFSNLAQLSIPFRTLTNSAKLDMSLHAKTQSYCRKSNGAHSRSMHATGDWSWEVEAVVWEEQAKLPRQVGEFKVRGKMLQTEHSLCHWTEPFVMQNLGLAAEQSLPTPRFHRQNCNVASVVGESVACWCYCSWAMDLFWFWTNKSLTGAWHPYQYYSVYWYAMISSWDVKNTILRHFDGFPNDSHT